jgi:hypothetical protein
MVEVIIVKVQEKEVRDLPIMAFVLRSKFHRLFTPLIEELAYQIGELLSL